MSVLGIDLAASPKKTYACSLDSQAGTLRAELFAACDDDRLLALAEGREKVGVDAPFGWPRDFVTRSMLTAGSRHGPHRTTGRPRRSVPR
jgi:hypothetical protein